MSSKKRRIYTETDIAATVHVEADIHIKLSNEVKKKKKNIPKFRLKGTTGNIASIVTPKSERVPLMLTDVQHLLLHSLVGNLNLTQPPRWYVLDKCLNICHTICLVIEGMSIDLWEKHRNILSFDGNIFNDYVEIITPSAYDGSLVDELALVPLSETEKDSLIAKYGSMNLALETRKDLNIMMRAVFPIVDDSHSIKKDNIVKEDNVGNEIEEKNELTKQKDKFPRTQLIMSAWQLAEENYPIPLKGKFQRTYSEYVMTKDVYKPVTAESPMFGIDCEMCVTNAGSELTRVSIVNENHETVYESLVKPYNNITDYLTRFSGINKEMLQNIDKRLEDVQNEIRALLPPDAILIGQSLNSDLHALKMMHPYVIDTSLIFNFTGERTRKPKLKVLAKELLKEDIQKRGSIGHDSVEDSLASLKLVQLKLNKNMEFGDAVYTNRQKYKENYTKIIKSTDYAMSIFNHMIEQKKSSIVIGCDDITGDYHTYLTKAKDSVYSQLKKVKTKKVKLCTVDSTEDVVNSLIDSSKDYNFAMGHVKLSIDDENETTQIENIRKWIESTWNSIEQSSLFAVVFGGTTSCNGMAMMKVKP